MKADSLLVMRLDEMERVHPKQDNSRVCGTCGKQVGIYPSGQEILKKYPTLEIICNVCAALGPPVAQIPVPGALDEIGQSVRKKP